MNFVFGNNRSTLKITVKTEAKDQTIPASFAIQTVLPLESAIPLFISMGIKHVFGLVVGKVREKLTGQLDGTARLVVDSVLFIGVLEHPVCIPQTEEFPLANLDSKLAEIASSMETTFQEAVAKIKLEKGLRWDDERGVFTADPPQSEEYGYPGEDSLLDALLGLTGERAGSGATPLYFLRRGPSSENLFGRPSRSSGLYSSEIERTLDTLLRDMLSGEPGSGRRADLFSQRTAPQGYYYCSPLCIKLHKIADTVRELQELKAHLDGRIPLSILSPLPFPVLEAYARAEGGYWDPKTSTVLPIPYDKYPNGEGGLSTLPFRKFFSREEWAIADIPNGMYLTPDGLDHIPQECYLSPAGLAELPPGKYPLETGILADIPAGSKWDPAAYALVPETETA